MKLILQVKQYSRWKPDPIEGSGYQSARRSAHPLMTAREILRVEGRVVFAFPFLAPVLALAGSLFFYMISMVFMSPELPGMGMGRLRMGSPMIGFSGLDMGMDEEEGSESENQVGHRQEQGQTPSMPSLSPYVEDCDHIPP